METWEKFKGNVEAHPYLFGGVALAIVIWIFWPSGSSSGSSSLSATEAAAIANTAQANAALTTSADQMNTAIQLSHDQVTTAGINAAAAQAINGQNTAAATTLAQIQANDDAYRADSAVKLAGIAAGAQSDLENAILSSQTSAQNYVTNLEMNKKNVQDFGVLGYTGTGSPTININALAPKATSVLYGGSQDSSGTGPGGTSSGPSGNGSGNESSS